jgi:hypothetical protein
MTFLNVSLDRQFAVLRDQAEALDLLQTATRVSTEALGEAVGVPAHGFEKWLSEAAPTDQKKLDAEKAEFQAESVEAGAKALPLAARMSLVEQLLATNTAEITKAA